MYLEHSPVLVEVLADDYQQDCNHVHQLSIVVETVVLLVKTMKPNLGTRCHQYQFHARKCHCLFRSHIGMYRQHLYPALGLFFVIFFFNKNSNFCILHYLPSLLFGRFCLCDHLMHILEEPLGCTRK